MSLRVFSHGSGAFNEHLVKERCSVNDMFMIYILFEVCWIQI